jgi:hypothetical protein
VASWSRTRIAISILGLLTAVVIVYQWWTGSPATAPVQEVAATGGSYAGLAAEQRRLIDDWTSRLGQATGRQVDAGNLFDALPLSTRTTFNAVTHALAKTPLTTTDGAPLNLTALDLIARVDAVAGSMPDAGGDKQFRMYVQLRPDTQQILERSREFSRQVDNTVYHKGYPICFRGSGGTPSIQFSLSPDGTRGDIDVDYRSSAFPIMLLNGHLTASNSDVRAGNNDERHNGHWQGLANWWRDFMGLAVGDLPGADAAAANNRVSTEPRLGPGTAPADAVADFMKAWLVEQNPAVAAGYVAPRAFACLETERGAPVDRGVARFQFVSTMQAVNARIGKVDAPAQAAEGVPLTGTRAREIPQPNRDAFVLYDVRDDLAQSLDCENRLHPELADPKRARSTEFGHYVGAVFRLKAGDARGDSVATLWSDESGSWKLVAYATEPEFTPGALPNAPPPADTPATAPLPVVGGDADMLRASHTFFDTWFIQKQPAAAFEQLSPASYTCYNAFRGDDAPEAATREEAGTRLLERMTRASELAGNAARLEDLMTGIEPHHPDLRLVSHAASAAFTVVAIPEAMAAAAECDRLKPGVAPRVDRGGPQEYGQFYAASFRLQRAGADGAVLWTIWTKEKVAWKVVSFLVVAP